MVSFVPSTPSNIKGNYMLILFVKENKKLMAVDSETNKVITVKMTKSRKGKKRYGRKQKGYVGKNSGKK